MWLNSCKREIINNKEKASIILSMRMKNELLDFPSSFEDRNVLNSLLEEINVTHETSFCTIAELASLSISGVGKIIAKYISQFSSKFIKMELLHHMVTDKIENCGKILLRLYSDYKLKVFGMPQYHPCMETAYDNAFWRLRSKRIKNELAVLVSNPIDAFALPFTIRMLASWRVKELREILIEYLEIQDSAMGEDLQKYDNFDFICRELRFSALDCFKYYSSDEAGEIFNRYSENNDADVQRCAKDSLAYMLRNRSR